MISTSRAAAARWCERRTMLPCATESVFSAPRIARAIICRTSDRREGRTLLGVPGDERRDERSADLVRGKCRVEQLQAGRGTTIARGGGERGQNFTGAKPVFWHREQRERPTEGSPATSARRLSEC